MSLNVSKELIIKRILGRQTCTKCGLIFNEYFKLATDKNHACGIEFLVKRPDDAKKTALHRYKTYLNKTLPILDLYKKLNLLHEIDGKAKIDQIFEKIRHIIASLEA
jgi:adenylate kinase